MNGRYVYHAGQRHRCQQLYQLQAAALWGNRLPPYSFRERTSMLMLASPGGDVTGRAASQCAGRQPPWIMHVLRTLAFLPVQLAGCCTTAAVRRLGTWQHALHACKRRIQAVHTDQFAQAAGDHNPEAQDHAQLTQDGDAPEENDEAHQDQGCPAQQRLASAPAYHPQIDLGSTRHLHQLNAPCQGSKRRLVPDTCRATPQGIWCPESTGSACGAQPRGLPANEGVPEAKSVPQVLHQRSLSAPPHSV